MLLVMSQKAQWEELQAGYSALRAAGIVGRTAMTHTNKYIQ